MADLIELTGMRVTAVTDTKRPKRLAGVLLPPIKQGGRYRLHVELGEVRELDPARWLVAPVEPLDVRKNDRRRSRCPAGRPLYRHSDLPADALATATMLKRIRRRLAEGQEPVASYMMMRDYAPLYAVADTVAMPPLTETQQARWDRARLCFRCGATQANPYEKSRWDDRRYCEDCHEPAAEEHWDRERALDRKGAAMWARAVVADPETALVHVWRGWPHTQARAEALDGTVLVDLTLRVGLNDGKYGADRLSAEERAGLTDPQDAHPVLAKLEPRRLIVWRWRDGVDALVSATHLGGADVYLTIREGDLFGHHLDGWRGERSRHGHSSYRHNQKLRQQEPESWDPAEVVAAMRAGLQEMARGWTEPARRAEADLSPEEEL